MSTPTQTRAPSHGWNSRRAWLVDPTPRGGLGTADALRERLLGPLAPWRDLTSRDRLLVWLVPLAVGLVAGIIRFTALDRPHALVFDETYYVKDAYSYLLSGVERNWAENANELFVRGDMSGILNTPEYVVHPPVGKWMIALGLAIFGPGSSFGWRFTAALVGTLSVMLTAWAAHRLFRSHTLAASAGLLLAVDGHHIVLSRTGILDIFLSFWVLAAFCALLLDREDGRRRLAARLGALASPDGRLGPVALAGGPWLGVRWWRLAAGVCLGLAVGVKWSALAFVAAFGLLTVLWDASARRTAGIRGWLPAAVLRDAPGAFASIVLVGALVYTASWSGWFASDLGYFRTWAAEHPDPAWGWVPEALRSLAHDHAAAYCFHNGRSPPHPAASAPGRWRRRPLLLHRPLGGQPACLVGRDRRARHRVPALGGPARLAGRGRSRGGRGGLPAVVPVSVPDDVRVLLRRVRALPRPGPRPHAGPHPGPARRPRVASPGGTARRRRVPARGPRRLGLPRADLDRRADPLPRVASADVDAELDLGLTMARACDTAMTAHRIRGGEGI